jgi:hypothetical protein
MENDQNKIRWYNCEKCRGRNPIPDIFFLEATSDTQETGLLDYCLHCDEQVKFLRRDAGSPVSKEEALNWFKDVIGKKEKTLFIKLLEFFQLK